MSLHAKVFLSIIALVLCSAVSDVQSENILVVSFFSSKSHKNVYEPLLFELANKGHKLTIISPYKSSKSHPNIVKEIVGASIDNFLSISFFERRLKKEFMSPKVMMKNLENLCNSYYEMPELKELMKTGKFDLIIGSYFWNECTYGLFYHFQAPFILIHPSQPFASSYQANGNPTPLSFVPLPFLTSSDRMTFKERLINWFVGVAFSVVDEVWRIPVMERIYRKHIGEHVPSIHDIERNVSVIFTNSHFSVNTPRPQMPDLIDIGGMHCRPAKPLDKELDDFLRGSGKDGFIYFSMGSVVKGNTMPEKYRKTLLNAFSKLKQRVLWKWETDMTDLPPNVRLGKWLPQQDVLGHPNIRIFITHGGLLSTEEAVYHGVPLIGIPIAGDQDRNMKQAEANGFALTVEFVDMTEEKLTNAINSLLTEPEYKNRAEELSKLFKDRPEKPLDKALFWTEYVMRHKGAAHLRSPARYLNTFVYHSIDVVAFLISVLGILLYFLYKVSIFVIRKVKKVIFGEKTVKKEIFKKKTN